MTSKNRKRKRSKGALLIRRIAIVATLILIMYLMGRGIMLVIDLLNREEEAPITINLTTEPLDLFVPDVSAETTNGESDTSTGETTTDESTTEEISTSETTSGEDTSPTGETTTNDVTKAPVATTYNHITYYIEGRDSRYAEHARNHPLKSEEQIVLEVNMNHDFSFYENIQPAVMPNDLLVLCNKYYKLDAAFTPKDLVDVKEGYYVNDGKTYKLASSAHDAFIKMADAAKKDGLSLKIISAYRTNSFQANLYEKYKDRNGQTAADRFSARAGHSEHETGLAVDINDVSSAFENTEEFKWLQKHAHEYGFILRYPKNSEHITGYMYESWHYRYVGETLAAELLASDLTFDAYHATVLYERYE